MVLQVAFGFVGTRICVVDILRIHPQVVHTQIRDSQHFKRFYASFVYASPQGVTRRELWPFLSSLTESIDGPWILTRNFNCVLDNSEQARCVAISNVGCKRFRDFLFYNALKYLGAS